MKNQISGKVLRWTEKDISEQKHRANVLLIFMIIAEGLRGPNQGPDISASLILCLC